MIGFSRFITYKPNGSTGDVLNGRIRSLPGFDIPMSDIAYNKAVEKLFDKLRGGLDLSVDGFEISKTIAMVKNMRQRVFQLLSNAAKRRRLRTVNRARRVNGKRSYLEYEDDVLDKPWGLRNIGSYWLEFQYGWRPTINSIYGLVDELQKRVPNMEQVSVTAKFDNNRQEVVNYAITVPGTGVHQQRSEFKTSIRVKITGAYTHSSHWSQSAARLTSLNPASIAWELFPLSFVADWVFNMGQYLRSLESSLLLRGSFYGTQSYTILRQVSSQFTKSVVTSLGGGSSTMDLVSAKGNNREVDFARSIINTLPLPRPPTVHLNMGAQRLISAASLLSQALGRRPSSFVYNIDKPKSF